MSVFTPEIIEKCIGSCDERIASFQEKLNSWTVYDRVLNLVKLELEIKYQDKIQLLKNNIKLIQTEKLLYNALSNPKSNKAIFPKLLSKYDELMSLSYDISGNLVNSGMEPEGDHLDYCRDSLKQREYIRKMCFYGENK